MTPWLLATRSEVELGELREWLALHGIEVRAFPTLREEAHHAPAQWEALVHRFEDVRWVVFTSPRAAGALLREAEPYDLAAALRRIPCAAVGRATAMAASAAGFRVEVVGDSGGGRLAELLALRLRPSSTVLHACGCEHRDDLAAGLRRCGHDVIELPVYAMAEAGPGDLPRIPDGMPCAVLLSSPKAALAYLDALGTRFARVPHIAMGPATAEAMHGSAIPVVVLERPTADAVVEELCQICS